MLESQSPSVSLHKVRQCADGVRRYFLCVTTVVTYHVGEPWREGRFVGCPARQPTSRRAAALPALSLRPGPSVPSIAHPCPSDRRSTRQSSCHGGAPASAQRPASRRLQLRPSCAPECRRFPRAPTVKPAHSAHQPPTCVHSQSRPKRKFTEDSSSERDEMRIDLTTHKLDLDRKFLGAMKRSYEGLNAMAVLASERHSSVVRCALLGPLWPALGTARAATLHHCRD